MQDSGLVDLPYPLRRMSLNPVGTLQVNMEGSFVFRRGTEALPSVGATVALPTDHQLRSIVESGEHRRIKIGSSPIAGDADVYVDPNRLFGRHLAVLGNTGSGKSCSVAGLIRWSIEQAQRGCATPRRQSHERGETVRPNARFIVLDPNGEYARAFTGGDSTVRARVYTVGASDDHSALRVPLWLWNTAEWCSFTQASARTQRPLLRRALREVKAGRTEALESDDEERKRELRRYLTYRLILIRGALQRGEIQEDENKFGFRLKAILQDLMNRAPAFPEGRIEAIIDGIKQALSATYNSFDKNGKTIEYFRAFTEKQVEVIIEAISESIACVGGSTIGSDGISEDAPIPFRGSDLADHLEELADQEGVTQYIDFLIARIRTFLSDRKMTVITEDTGGISLGEWLRRYVGDDSASSVCVSVIDLSLVPTDIVHIIAAVIARMVFEALQRYVKHTDMVLPTVLVMEEAHTFAKRYRDDPENVEASTVCCQVFERIAREGRKFGLGLVVSSQRPSELSPTVLSQCNTFLLHRISNNHDQDIVHRLVPDNLRGLLRELPSLPSQMAIMLGWASELPVLVRMNDLPIADQPRSDDPEFWKVWTRKCERDIDWESVAEQWQEGIGRRQWGEKEPPEDDGIGERLDSGGVSGDDLPF